MIFDLYESGLGVQAIRNELIKRKRKNSSGLIKWDSTRILRCLKNTTYKGVMAYNKSHRNNFLEQKVIVNHDENTFDYVVANFEPIITEEQWEHCKLIRESKRNLRIVNVDGKAKMQFLGVHKGEYLDKEVEMPMRIFYAYGQVETEIKRRKTGGL